MNTITHLFVLPVTGPYKDQGRKCYVCQFGSAPAIVAFIKPESPQLEKYIEYIQKMDEKWDKLYALVIILTETELDEKLKNKLQNLEVEKKLTVPLTVLDPVIGLPDSISINPEAELTLLLYIGKHFDKLGEISPGTENYNYDNASPQLVKCKKYTTVDAQAFNEVPEFVALDADAPAEIVAIFRDFDKAAKEMIYPD